MNEFLKDVVNYLSNPTIFFTGVVILWILIMKYYRVWTAPRFIKGVLIGSLLFLGWALFDADFAKEALKPDNVPIWIMTYSVGFFFWLAMRRGMINDDRMAEGKPSLEKLESDKKVYTWPDLVYSELICMVLFTAFLIGWAIILKAPLEDPANAGVTPAIAKAPWYFLGLQEILVYYDPWMAGVVLPGMIVVGLVGMPYFDTNPKGNGYYTIKERFWALWVFGFGFIVLWIALIFLGTFMRGPGWNFFGPFEYWDSHKVVALANINLSEIVWTKIMGVGLPSNILVREFVGLSLVGIYIVIPPIILAKTVLKKLLEEMGIVRYSLVILLLLVMVSLPIKMYLRWSFNLKYIVAIPEYMFNI